MDYKDFVVFDRVAQGHKGVSETRQLWVRSPLKGINYYFLIFLFSSLWHEGKSSALSSATSHVMSRKIRRKVYESVWNYI